MKLRPTKLKKTTKSVRIVKGDNKNNSIPDEAFRGHSSLESLQMEDDANITTIGEYAFNNCTSLLSVHISNTVASIKGMAFWNCSSLRSVNIPNSVISIKLGAFSGCSSLPSVNIPSSVKYIEDSAFKGCSSLRSIYIPDTVTEIGFNAFGNCDKLKQRLTDGPNYHRNTAIWLRQRFKDLPIHQACYDANGNYAKSTDDLLSTLVLLRDNKQKQEALVATDAMGMTPLHILCCNPNITVEMVQVLVEKEDALALAHTDVTGNTPLQLFLRCRGYLNLVLGDEQEDEESMPSLCNLLKRGIKEKDLAILFALNGNQQIDIMSGQEDEQTGLFPFMSAAMLPAYRLDTVYALAMNGGFSSIL